MSRSCSRPQARHVRRRTGSGSSSAFEPQPGQVLPDATRRSIFARRLPDRSALHSSLRARPPHAASAMCPEGFRFLSVSLTSGVSTQAAWFPSASRFDSLCRKSLRAFAVPSCALATSARLAAAGRSFPLARQVPLPAPQVRRRAPHETRVVDPLAGAFGRKVGNPRVNPRHPVRIDGPRGLGRGPPVVGQGRGMESPRRGAGHRDGLDPARDLPVRHSPDRPDLGQGQATPVNDLDALRARHGLPAVPVLEARMTRRPAEEPPEGVVQVDHRLLQGLAVGVPEPTWSPRRPSVPPACPGPSAS